MKESLGTMSQFSRQLLKYRKKCGYTQQQVADSINLNRTTYNKYENGVTEPSHETLKKIVKLFDISFDDLFCEDSDGADLALADSGINGSLQKEERKLLTFFRSLSDEERKVFLSEADDWKKSKKENNGK